MPSARPEIVTVPKANYIAISGAGDPNEADGAYKKAVGVLYAIAYTIKMSKMGDHRIDGYFDFVVPPLEGFWWQEGVDGIDYANKTAFRWISVIRLPDFVTKADFEWAVTEAACKKNWTAPKRSSGRSTRGRASRFYISVRSTMSRHPSRSWTNFLLKTVMKTIFRMAGCTTKFIFPMREKWIRPNGKP